jgi:hypothetical protein
VDQTEYETLKRKAQTVRDLAVNAADREYFLTLQAIETVWGLSKESKEETRGRPPAKSGAVALTREAVSQLEPGYARRDVIRKIAELHPDAKIKPKAITFAMDTLVKRNEIFVLKRQVGSHPQTYSTGLSGIPKPTTGVVAPTMPDRVRYSRERKPEGVNGEK